MPTTWWNNVNVDKVVLYYIGTLLWSSTHGDDGESFDDYDSTDLAPEYREQIKTDIINFLDRVGNEVIECYLNGQWTEEGIGGRLTVHDDAFPPQDEENLGSDFCLTRNRHGVGFWDRGIGKIGDLLSEICHEFGEDYPYLGDDGVIYRM